MTEPDAPFQAPWQARAFALAVHLSERGAFTWGEWAEALGAEIARDGYDYWAAWIRALEAIVQGKGLARREEATEMTLLWHQAARATSHGKPIELSDPASCGTDTMGSPGDVR